MKKNKMMRIASVLLVAVLLSTCAISGTFAKYTSEATATAIATVAKWDVKLEDKAFNETITFDFTETWTDTDTDSDGKNHVVAKKLAPGTAGSFDLKVTNDSEVDAKFYMTFDFTGLAAIPLEYSYEVDGVAYTPAVDSWINIAMGNSAVVTVTWEWPFEAKAPHTDADDTALGESNVRDYTAQATLVMEQVD